MPGVPPSSTARFISRGCEMRTMCFVARKKTHGLKTRRAAKAGAVRLAVSVNSTSSSCLGVFLGIFCRHVPGLVTSFAKLSLRRCRSVYNSALARGEERLWDSSHALEPGNMYTTIVSVYTTASVFSNPARGPTVFTGVVAS